MWVIEPDILVLTRQLSPPMCFVGFVLGAFLWSFGARTHRFWLALIMTVSAGALGLSLGRDYGVQPLVAGLLMALAAGVMALALARISLFLLGGLCGMLLTCAAGAGWNEMVCFLTGGLIGVCLYDLWITVLSSLAGTVLMAYSLVSVLDRFARINSIALAEKHRPLINWGIAGSVAVGMLVQYLLERRRKKRSEKKSSAPPPQAASPPPPPPPPPPPRPQPPWWKAMFQKAA